MGNMNPEQPVISVPEHWLSKAHLKLCSFAKNGELSKREHCECNLHPGQFQIKCLTYSLAWHAIDDSKIFIYIYIINVYIDR